MKHSDDIVNLFQQFGAKADPYHELARKQEHKLSNERWPLVSAVRNAVADDVPSVDRSATASAAPIPLRGQDSPLAKPEPAVAVQRATPAAAGTPNPVRMPVAVSAPDREPPSAVRASPSPLSSLAGLRAQTAPAVAEERAVRQDSFPEDLPSVFARLGAAPAQQSAALAPAWQPRKSYP